MKSPATSVLIFGVYLFGVAAILLLMPNVLLGILGLPETNEVWVRVAGMLAGLIGFYYVMAARSNLRVFFQWTVYARVAVIIFFIAFVLLGWAKAPLILLGLADLAGALWTEWALRQTR